MFADEASMGDLFMAPLRDLFRSRQRRRSPGLKAWCSGVVKKGQMSLYTVACPPLRSVRPEEELLCAISSFKLCPFCFPQARRDPINVGSDQQ